LSGNKKKSSVCANWEGWWQCDLGNGKDSTKEMWRADRQGVQRRKTLKAQESKQEADMRPFHHTWRSCSPQHPVEVDACMTSQEE